MDKNFRDRPESATGERGLAVGAWAAHRRLYLDNLKVVLVAAIIAGHGIASYADGEIWPYSEIRETTLADATTIGLLALVGPFALFMIPLLFLVAGLLAPGSLERKGPGRYARDRLLRLGIPFAVFVLVLWPPLMYPIHPPGETPPSYWYDFTHSGGWGLDAGVMWFVGVLLIFSLGYTGWTRWRSRRPGRFGLLARRRVSLGGLLLLALAVTVTTFLIRLVYEYDGDEYLVDLNMYQWPQCLAMFGLGVVASRQGWLTAIPDLVRRRCRTATLVAGVAFGAFMAYGASTGAFEGESAWKGGLNLDALAFTTLESTMAVVGPVWLLAVAQRHLDRPLRWARPAVSRSAYGAFMLQGYVLIGLAVALRPLPLTAEIKALLVAGGSMAGSFALAWLLIKRAPGMGRVL
ncbi:acyltransferase family protein [Aeromicrobium sp.]|uniref:acyltransferase family protein n=1 Tax=Aeromicrobium sp. TaxID=1871063 RepID=UPI002FCBE592